VALKVGALFIAELTMAVTYAWPWWTLDGGCSLSAREGVTHETAARVPGLAAAKFEESGWYLKGHLP
jgi:hypothetical protein